MRWAFQSALSKIVDADWACTGWFVAHCTLQVFKPSSLTWFVLIVEPLKTISKILILKIDSKPQAPEEASLDSGSASQIFTDLHCALHFFAFLAACASPKAGSWADPVLHQARLGVRWVRNSETPSDVTTWHSSSLWTVLNYSILKNSKTILILDSFKTEKETDHTYSTSFLEKHVNTLQYDSVYSRGWFTRTKMHSQWAQYDSIWFNMWRF